MIHGEDAVVVWGAAFTASWTDLNWPLPSVATVAGNPAGTVAGAPPDWAKAQPAPKMIAAAARPTGRFIMACQFDETASVGQAGDRVLDDQGSAGCRRHADVLQRDSVGIGDPQSLWRLN